MHDRFFQEKQPDPMIVLKLEFDAEGFRHLWISIANYQAYRDNDPDPEIEVLPPNHPLMRIQHTINGMLDQLISDGMKGGFYIAPLLEIKQILTEIAEASDNDG